MHCGKVVPGKRALKLQPHQASAVGTAPLSAAPGGSGWPCTKQGNRACQYLRTHGSCIKGGALLFPSAARPLQQGF